MDIIKQYITQCIISAANNLRLSTEKIEVVALLRETISSSEDLENEIRELKKITEFSTFAIKLGEVYNFIGKGKIDFLKLTDKFKEHSYLLVKDLNNLLERVSPQNYRQIIQKIKEPQIQVDLTREDQKAIVIEQVSNDLTIENEVKNEEKLFDSIHQEKENEKLKEDFILEEEDEEKDDFLFENYEERILKPIKELDAFLKNLTPDKINNEEIERFYEIVSKNADLSARKGFEIIANMHSIFANTLELIKEKSVFPVKEVIEGMRACLIVIVAVVRGKEVDISGYLNKAEGLGKQIQNS